MSAAGKTSSVINLGNLDCMLRDPVSTDPYGPGLKSARVLVPCGHTTSLETFTNLQRSAAPCPLCRERITAAVPNPLIDQIAGEIFCAQTQEIALPADSKKLPAEPEMDLSLIPFPGKGARFELENSGWDTFRPSIGGGTLVRSMDLKSIIPESLFSEFKVLGYDDHTVALCLKWRHSTAVQYLANCGVIINPTDSYLSSGKFSTPTEMRKVFKILALHNEIPEPHFTLSKKLIEAGDWALVTPLTPEQQRDIKKASLTDRDDILERWQRLD